MDETKNFVVSQLQANGGTMSYRALHEAAPFEQRRNLFRATSALKQEGVITKEVKLGENGIEHTISLV